MSGDPPGASAIADVRRVRALLIEAARAGEAVSYAGLLLRLGERFTRPRMRALCRTLDAIDRAGAVAGEPALAVLVVREIDRLPGQGWWQGHARATGYAGAWTGAAAAAAVRRGQAAAFAYWVARQATTWRARQPRSLAGVGWFEGDIAMTDDDRAQIAMDFHAAVNMTPAALETWLATDDSKAVGWKGADGKGSGESVGHQEGKRIVAILRKAKTDLDDADHADMKKVTGYVHRHLAQGGPAQDVEHSRWRYSLMNWGHDPAKR